MKHLIDIFIQTPLSSFWFGYVCAEALSSSPELHPGGLEHTSQTALLQAFT